MGARWHAPAVRGILRRVRRLALACCLLLCPNVAAARSVVVVVGAAEDPVELRAAVIEAIAERGVRLVRTPDGEICDADPVPCAAALAARTGADAALRVDLESSDEPRVRVRLVPAEGDAVDVEELVRDGDLQAAVSVAVGRALDVAPAPMGFLLVRSDPPGGRLEVDGDPQGTTPLRVTLAPGEHTVRLVRASGAVQESSVTIVAGEEATWAPEASGASAATEPEPPAPEGPRVTRSEASPFNWIIGGALAIGGVIMLISPLSTIAREGQCEEAIEDVGCVEMVRFGPQSGVLLGVGLALLIAAVVVDAVSPIRVDVEVSSTEARVGVRGTF